MILTFMDDGARAVISFCIRSEIPGYMVVPPDCDKISTSFMLDVAHSTHHDNIAVEVFSDINVALHDRVEGCDVDATTLKAENAWLEHSLRSTETLIANGDDLAIGKLVRLFQAGALRSGLDFLLEVESNVAKLLLDVTDNLTFGGGGERVPALCQNLHQIIRQVPTSHIDTRDGVGKSKPFINGDDVSDTITRVQHDARCTTGGVEREDGLNGDVEGGGIESLEDDLSHLFAIGLGVDGSFGEENGVFFGSNTELIVEGVMPNLLHVIPIGDDAMLDGISKSEDAALRLCFITNIGILLAHTNHNAFRMVSFQCSKASICYSAYPW